MPARTLREWRQQLLAYFTNNGGTEAADGMIELHRRIACTAGISVGAHSTKGDIDFGSASIHWINANNGNFNLVNRLVTGNVNATTWGDFIDQPTGSGTVLADMDGDLFVGSLTICYMYEPSDVENVT